MCVCFVNISDFWKEISWDFPENNIQISGVNSRIGYNDAASCCIELFGMFLFSSDRRLPSFVIEFRHTDF